MTTAVATAAVPRGNPDLIIGEPALEKEANASAVSWAAVAGGAFVAASLSLILLALGAGLGLSSVSPWSSAGASASVFGGAAVIWLIATEIISSSMGGYLAGRLRTKWTAIHSDEVYFRDTAHGFLAWAVALVISAAFLASAAATLAGGSAQTTQTSTSEPNAYFVDSLFRSNTPAAYDNAVHQEAGRILTAALTTKEMSAADHTYLAQLVAGRTGLSPADADRRVSDVTNDARQALESARKATAHLLLWLFIALLCGAFFASFSATIGGRQRDNVQKAL